MSKINLKTISALAIGCSVSLALAGPAEAAKWTTKVADGHYFSSAGHYSDTLPTGDNAIDATYLHGKTIVEPGKADTYKGWFFTDQMDMSAGADVTQTGYIKLYDTLISLSKRITTTAPTLATDPATQPELTKTPVPDEKIADAVKDLNEGLISPFTIALPAISNSRRLISNLFSGNTRSPKFIELDLGLGRIEYASVGAFSDYLMDSNLGLDAAVGISSSAFVTWFDKCEETCDGATVKTTTHLNENGMQYGGKLTWAIPVNDMFSMKMGMFGGYVSAEYGGLYRDIAGNKFDKEKTPADAQKLEYYIQDADSISSSMLQIGGFGGMTLSFDTGSGMIMFDLEAYADWARINTSKLSPFHAGKYQTTANIVTDGAITAADAKVKMEIGPGWKKVADTTAVGVTYEKSETVPADDALIYATQTITIAVQEKLEAVGNKGYHVGGNLEMAYVSPALFNDVLTFNLVATGAFDYHHVPELVEGEYVVEITDHLRNLKTNILEAASIDNTGDTTWVGTKTVVHGKLEDILNHRVNHSGDTAATALSSYDAVKDDLAKHYSSLFALKSSALGIFRMNVTGSLGVSINFANVTQSATALPIILDLGILGGYKYAPEIEKAETRAAMSFAENATADPVEKGRVDTVKYGEGSGPIVGAMAGMSIVTESIVARGSYKLTITPSGANHLISGKIIVSFR